MFDFAARPGTKLSQNGMYVRVLDSLTDPPEAAIVSERVTALSSQVVAKSAKPQWRMGTVTFVAPADGNVVLEFRGLGQGDPFKDANYDPATDPLNDTYGMFLDNVVVVPVPTVVDLDVDSDNTGVVDRTTDEDVIEADENLPGVIVAVGGSRAKMVVERSAGKTARLELAEGTDKVIVWDAAAGGSVVLSESAPGVDLTAQTGNDTFVWSYWIEAIDVSESLADIAFRITLDDESSSAPRFDVVRATAVTMTVQSNGIISADDGKLWVYSGISEFASAGDSNDSGIGSGAVTFEVLTATGAPTGVTGSASVNGSFAYTVLSLPDSMLKIDRSNPTASTYRVRARYRSLTFVGSETVVLPGLADQIEAVATAAFTNQPGFSFDITDSNVPFLRDFAGTGQVTVQATVRDRLGNIVEDGTPVVWGTIDDGFAPDDVANAGTETLEGVASFAIDADRIAPVARLSVTADQKTIQGFLSGGALNVDLQLLDPNAPEQWNTIIDLDNRWWYSTQSQSIRLRAVVTRTDGSSVGAGVPVKFHDTKKLLSADAVLTNADGIAEVDLFVPNDRATWSILGGNVVTASAAGYADQEIASIVGRNRPPVELEFSHAVLAGDTTTSGVHELPDVDASSGFDAKVNVPYAASGTITLRNLSVGEPYRLEVPADSALRLRLPEGTEASHQVRFTPTTSTFVIHVESTGAMSGSDVDVVKPLLYLEATWWNWFEDPVGYAVKGDGTGTIIVGPSSAASRIGQITQSIVSGGIFGSHSFDASLAGDIGFSLIPGVGVISDVRELGKSLLKLMPIDLGLGPFDWREAAIAGFGILTEVIPPADAIVDAYRAMYKIAKQVPAVMPVFLSVEPLFTKALQSLFSYTPAAPAALMSAGGDDALMASFAASASSGFDDMIAYLGGILEETDIRRLLTHTDVAKKLQADEVFNGKYLDLARIKGSKFADDIFTISDTFGVDTLVDMIKAADGNLEDFGAGFNAMATAIRRHAGGGTWQNAELIASLKADPEEAAKVFTNFGTTSRKVQEAQQRFGNGIAGESDVSQAIGLVIGRTSANGGHSFTKTLDQLRHFSEDLKTITDFDPGDLERMRAGIILIRRFRKDGARLPTQAGRLFEVQEVAAALRADPNTVIGFNKIIDGGPAGRTDVDVLLNGKAIELKLTVNAADEEALIKKFVKYFTVPEAAENLELRSLSSVDEMRAAVEAAFGKYVRAQAATWPDWLQEAVARDNTALARIQNAIAYTQAPASRYNYFAGAGI
jgi:hypothetical protein